MPCDCITELRGQEPIAGRVGKWPHVPFTYANLRLRTRRIGIRVTVTDHVRIARLHQVDQFVLITVLNDEAVMDGKARDPLPGEVQQHLLSDVGIDPLKLDPIADAEPMGDRVMCLTDLPQKLLP